MRIGGQRTNVSARHNMFDRFTKELTPALWRTAYRMTGNREAADDLFQDTCIKAYKSFDQYEAGTNYKAWLFRILTNTWKDGLRKQARTPTTSWDEKVVEKATVHDRRQPEFECENQEFYNHAIDAISRLTPPVRLVVCFSLLDGLSYQEIADIADIPIGTVRSRLSRGRRQLQDVLAAHYLDENTQSVVTNAEFCKSTEKKVARCDGNARIGILT